MDRRSWLWRRKSSETESSGSASSHSERYLEDQESLRVSSVNVSPNNYRSPEVSSKLNDYDPNETIKSLNEKLSAALLSINSKEELIHQHVKVAEEAVAGWEKAEAEVADLKKQLEFVLQKNFAIEDRTKQLDAALKECVRQLRQSREEQEQNFHETLTKKTKEWEDEKLELQTQIIELQAKLEVKAEKASSIDHQMCLKLEELEKEKSSLHIELLAKTEDLHLRTLERDLSTQAAETASKQHLEGIKKLAKLEAECRRLRSVSRKFSPLNDDIKPPCGDRKRIKNLTDSQSDSELDQFKNDKATKRNLASSTTDIDLMDDFLEMERLAALSEAEAGHESSNLDINGDSEPSVEVMLDQFAELKQKIARFEAEKVEMEMALSEKLESKLKEMESVEEERKAMEFQLISANREVDELQIKVHTLEGKVKEEEALSAKLAADMEDVEENRKMLSAQIESANLESVKLKERTRQLEEEVRQLHEKVRSLERIIDEERTSLTEFKAREEATMEEKEIAWESQIRSAGFEVEELQKKANLIERKAEEEKIGLAHLEVHKLHKEKSISIEPPVKKQYEKLLLRKEEDFVMASEMFVACQKTINSISQQLKSLSNFDNLMLESCGPSSSSS